MTRSEWDDAICVAGLMHAAPFLVEVRLDRVDDGLTGGGATVVGEVLKHATEAHAGSLEPGLHIRSSGVRLDRITTLRRRTSEVRRQVLASEAEIP